MYQTDVNVHESVNNALYEFNRLIADGIIIMSSQDQCKTVSSSPDVLHSNSKLELSVLYNICPTAQKYILDEAIDKFKGNLTKYEIHSYGVNKFAEELIKLYPKRYKKTHIKSVLGNIIFWYENIL